MVAIPGITTGDIPGFTGGGSGAVADSQSNAGFGDVLFKSNKGAFGFLQMGMLVAGGLAALWLFRKL